MAIVDDDFGGSSLGGHWTEYDPSSDLTVTVGGGVADLAIAAGSSHDFYTSQKNGGSIQQACGDVEFEIETGWDEVPGTDQARGIIAFDAADPTAYIRFDMYGSGNRLFFAHIAYGGVATFWHNADVAGPVNYLRLYRVDLGGGSWEWTPQWSTDGVAWNSLTAQTHPMVVHSVGVWVGNYTSNPAFSPGIDYFYDNLTAAITGSANITESADTGTSSGTLSISGSSSITESADTPAATGALAVDGAAAVTENADTSTASGTLAISGAASVTEAADTVSATGTVADGQSGEADITEAADTATASGTVSISGAASVTESADTASATGTLSIVGAASITEASDTTTATGTGPSTELSGVSGSFAQFATYSGARALPSQYSGAVAVSSNYSGTYTPEAA